MNSIYVSFNIKSLSSGLDTIDEQDKLYCSVYRPIAKFLYSHPDFSFSFTFTGSQLQFLKKRRNEFITIFKQLEDRKQVEIISGSGFYDSILPLIYPVDRNGQLDLISTQIRQTFGKRPRGISLFADCWDSSLVNCLQTCGFEYLLLESSIIPENKRTFLPLIMTDLGKAIEIFPYYDNLCPEVSQTPQEFVNKILTSVHKIQKKEDYFQLKPSRIVNINFSPEQIIPLIESKWFEKFSDYLTNNPDCDISTITPYYYRKLFNNDNIKVPAYIPAGINGSIAKWIGSAHSGRSIYSTNSEATSKQKNIYTVYDFMESYPQSHSIFDRIMYTSMLVNNYKNDKMRKKAAREKLWQAQNGWGILCTSKGAFSNSKYRQKCYKYLMEAEKILREDNSFKESVTCFDYNGDGFKEYVCRMQNYFSYIALKSGAIQELEILKNTGNYTDNLSRVKEYDSCNDDYERGIFIDHIFTHDQFKNYVKGEPAGDGIFSKVLYSELKYKQNHHEIQLFAYAEFPHTKQRIYLRKKYIINSTGMNVQYIIRNESEKTFKAVFAVESNFAHTNFDSENISYYTLEVVKKADEKNITDTKLDIDTTQPTGEITNIDIARISDLQSGISFGLEPNEISGFCYNPIIFKRPDFNGEDIIPVHMTFVSTLYWNLEIEPGKETERTINFTITSIKKKR